MKLSPLVSVIVPVYNAEGFLLDCVDSILGQSYGYFELILVDDGSKDGSGKICDDYSKKDVRVKVIHQANGGVSLARYNGIHSARGEWTCFVDADDYLPPKALEILLQASAGYDLVNGQTCIFDSKHGVNPNPSMLKYELGVYSGIDFSRNLILDRRNGALWRQIIRTEILKRSLILIPREVRISEDWLLSISIGLQVKTCIGIPDVVYYYNDNPGSVTHQVSRTLEDILIVDEYLDKMVGGKSEFSEALFRCRLRHFEKCIFNEEVMGTTFVQYLKQNRNVYRLTAKEKYLMTLTRVQHVGLRMFLWNLYLLPFKMINKVKYLLNKWR